MENQTKKMKIGLYNPYFDSFGGGERYTLTLAEHWSNHHDVCIFWDDRSMLTEAHSRFGLNLSKVTVVPNIFKSNNLVQKLIESFSYDVIFFLSDGSVPTSLAKYNILHFQVPFQHIQMNFWKATRYQSIVVNSEFTKNNLQVHAPIPIFVIYPPVDTDIFRKKAKKKTILSVGRFNGLYGAKKQDVLIETFIDASKRKLLKGWKLILAGGCLETDKHYVEQLQKKSIGYDIEFYINCSYSKLQTLYEESSIYWHAAGYGETNPEHMEHFGITTVEAMSAGCIPIVYNGGGQPEIVTHNQNGYLWRTPEELVHLTQNLIGDDKTMQTIREKAVTSTTQFSKKKFTESFDTLLYSLCK